MAERGGRERCPWAIKFGVTLHTRCSKPEGHLDSHVGSGLTEFRYQTVEWFPGDQREYKTARTDRAAWEDPDAQP